MRSRTNLNRTTWPNRTPGAGVGTRYAKLGGGFMAIAALAAACGSSPGQLGGAPKAKATSVNTPTVLVKGSQLAGLGGVLVTGNGLTLYRFALDTSTKSACNGGCALEWPPLTLPADEGVGQAGPGVAGLGTLRRLDGKLQVTFHGQPLYRFAGDKSPGQTHGQGFANEWFVVSPSAPVPTSVVTTTAPTPPTTLVPPPAVVVHPTAPVTTPMTRPAPAPPPSSPPMNPPTTQAQPTSQSPPPTTSGGYGY
jgi:predicted lipoprotein with Yx(FWY)xxD motif